MIEIEPHPKLIEYLNKVNSFDFDSDTQSNSEWKYIESNLDQNIFLIKELIELGVLPTNPIICDAGIGLGSILFDLYLQSLDFSDINFNFIGIEKNPIYNKFFKENLIKYWSSNFTLIEDDILNFNYSNTNFVWFFQPFSKSDLAMNFYYKVITEIPVGGIIKGIDHYNIMTYGDERLKSEFLKLEFLNLERFGLFRKK